jgi:hypothetical protein
MADPGPLAGEGNVRKNVEIYLEAFRWNEAGYREMIVGTVLPDLIKRAIRVEAFAKSGWNAPPGPPGGKPGVRTGRLRASITWRPGVDDVSPYVDIGSNVLYAPYVELGTRRMAARPFLRPALEAARASW